MAFSLILWKSRHSIVQHKTLCHTISSLSQVSCIRLHGRHIEWHSIWHWQQQRSMCYFLLTFKKKMDTWHITIIRWFLLPPPHTHTQKGQNKIMWTRYVVWSVNWGSVLYWVVKHSFEFALLMFVFIYLRDNKDHRHTHVQISIRTHATGI